MFNNNIDEFSNVGFPPSSKTMAYFFRIKHFVSLAEHNTEYTFTYYNFATTC